VLPALVAVLFAAGCGDGPTLLVDAGAAPELPAAEAPAAPLESGGVGGADATGAEPPPEAQGEVPPSKPVEAEPDEGGAPAGGASGAPSSLPAPPEPRVPAPAEPVAEPEPPQREVPKDPVSPADRENGDPPARDPEDGPDGTEPPGGATDEPPAEEPGSEAPSGDDTPPDGVGTAPDTDPVGPGSAEIPSDLSSFHIAVIGSSTANGIGASTGDFAWVTLLDEALSTKVATRYTTTNLAVGGYTAADLLPGSGAPGSIDDAIAQSPDLIVVALAGSNDLAPGFTTEMFMSQLGVVRDSANAAGIPAFFMSPLPKSLSVGEREILEQWSRLMAAEFGQCWIPGTAKAYAPCYIDVFDALADTSLGLATQFDSGDGQHPNDVGHSLLFGAVDAIVRPYVCTRTGCR
jgi:lysophospholipase L1-like esterase